MKKFRIRHLLLATAAICAFFRWNQLDKRWFAFRTFVALDGEFILAESGPVSRLFYSRRAGFDGQAWVEVSRPPLSKSTAYWLIGFTLLFSGAGMYFLRTRQEGSVFLAFEVLRMMCCTVVLYELPTLISWVFNPTVQ